MRPVSGASALKESSAKIEHPKFREVSALSGASTLKQRALRYTDVCLFIWRMLRAVSGASADKLYVVSSSESDQCSRLRMVRPVSEANASNCSDVTAYV